MLVKKGKDNQVIVMQRKGYGKGKGVGFRNLLPKDPYTHSMNARGVSSRGERPSNLYAEGEVVEVEDLLEQLDEPEEEYVPPAPMPDILINESGEGDVVIDNDDDFEPAPMPHVLMNSNLESDPDVVEAHEMEEHAQESSAVGFFPELEYTDVDRVPDHQEPSLLPSLEFDTEVPPDDDGVPAVPLPTVLIPEKEETFAQKVGKGAQKLGEGIKGVGQRGIKLVQEQRAQAIAKKQEIEGMTDNELRTMAIREPSGLFGGTSRYEKELLRREGKNRELKDKIHNIRTKQNVQESDSGDSPFGFITAPFETLGATGKKRGKR